MPMLTCVLGASEFVPSVLKAAVLEPTGFSRLSYGHNRRPVSPEGCRRVAMRSERLRRRFHGQQEKNDVVLVSMFLVFLI